MGMSADQDGWESCQYSFCLIFLLKGNSSAQGGPLEPWGKQEWRKSLLCLSATGPTALGSQAEVRGDYFRRDFVRCKPI